MPNTRKSNNFILSKNGLIVGCKSAKKYDLSKPRYKNNVKEFLRKTSCNGLKFIADGKISYFERYLFGVAFVIITIFAVYFVVAVYKRWNLTPIIMTKNTVPTSIKKFPFPAITICNKNQAKLSEARKLKRFFFILVLVTITGLAAYFVTDVYNKWNLTPVIVGKSRKPTSIKEFPFPAVTICNKNQAKKSQVSKLNRDSLEYGVLQMLCNRYEDINFTKLENEIANVSDHFKIFNDTIMKLGQPCTDLIIECSYGGQSLNCSQVFITIVTDEGLCCTFNSLHPSFLLAKRNETNISERINNDNDPVPVYWDAVKGYPDNLPKKFYPRTGTDSGPLMGLIVTLDIQIDEYYCSSTDGSGVKFNTHSPSETSFVKEIGLTTGVGLALLADVTPKRYYATEPTRYVSRDARQCVFNITRRIKHFRIYTLRNCLTECYAEMFSDICKCLPFYMPRIPTNISICNLKQLKCIRDLERDEHFNSARDKCIETCLPACFHVEYRINMNPGQFNHPIKGRSKTRFHEFMRSNYSAENIIMLAFFYEENAYYDEVRDEFVNMTTYLSYTGGLLSLFLGISFITFVEFGYYFFLKYFFTNHKYKKENRMLNR